MNLVEGLLKFHAIFGFIDSFVGKNIRVRLPRPIMVSLFLISVFINLTLSVGLTQAVLSACQNQRSFLNSLYKCQLNDQQDVIDISKKFGISLAIAFITCSLTMISTVVFARNYFKFMRNLIYPKIMKKAVNSSIKGELISDIQQFEVFPPILNVNSINQQYPSKKSSCSDLKDNKTGLVSEKQNLFKIQEMDEEQPQSPPMGGKLKVPFGEISNLPQSKSKNGKSALNQSRTSQEDREGCQDFHLYESFQNSYRKEDFKKQIRDSNVQNQKSLQNLQEQTTLVEGHLNLQNISMSRQLEGIREEEFEGTYQNGGQNKDEGNYKKSQSISEQQDSRSQNNSQINFLPEGQKKQSSKAKRILKIVAKILIVMFCILFVMGIVFNFYSLFNMTNQALESAFIIFGIGLLIDLAIMRSLFVLALALFQTLNSNFELSNERKLQKSTFDQISKIYEDYEVHFEDYEKLNQQSQFISEDLEQEQLKIPKLAQQRIMMPRQRPIGDIVLVEQTLFYQAPISLLMNRDAQNETNRNDNDSHIIATSMLGFKKQSTRGEKVEISNSISFKAEENLFKKPQILKKGKYGDQESNDDIEEIPIYSSRNNEERRDSQEDRNLVMPSGLHQFETPKPEQNTKGKLKDPRGSMFTQQIVTFTNNEQENPKKSVLRDMLGLSGSKKGSPNKSEYQSLKKYLAADRQNSIDSIMEQQKYQSPNRDINSKSSQILNNKDNFYKPQYNTLSKALAHQKSSKSGCKKSQSKVFDIKNGSDEEKSLFSDLKNINLNSEIELKKYHSSKKVNNFSYSKKSLGQRINDLERGSSTKKCDFDKENLGGKTVEVENKPNFSPFATNKVLVSNTKANLSNQNIQGIQQNSSMKNIPAFGSISKGGKTIIEHMGYGDHHHSSLDLTQPVFKKQNSPETKGFGSVTKTVEDSIDNNVKKMLKGGNKKAKKQIQKESSYIQQLGSINSNDFQDSEESLRSRKSPFKLQKIQMTKEEKKSKKTKKNKKNDSNKNYHDGNKSKVYEDDQNTFRMVNFGMKQSSVQQLNQLNQKSSRGIDFYSNGQTIDKKNANENSKEDFSLAQKIDFIHIEESPDRNQNKDLNIQPMILGQGETSPSSNDSEPYNSRRGNLSRMMKNINQEELIEAAHEAEDIRYKFQSRQSIGKDHKKSSSSRRRKRSNKGSLEYQDSTPQNQPSTKTRFNKMRRDKEEVEDFKLRVEEQKRKLSGFLKLAQQLKSKKDEQAISDLLEVIKDTKRPLPMSKINELKKLELMASPYNQSLITMIKDEYENCKKAMKAPPIPPPRGSKSMQRNEIKADQVLKHLSGIYGSVNGTQLSNRKGDKSMKASSMTREETTATKFTNVINKSNRVKNVKSMAREDSSRKDQRINAEGVIRIHKKNTQMPIVGYQNAIDVNSSLSNVGLTSEEDSEIHHPDASKNFRKMVIQDEEDEDINERSEV